MKKDNIIYIKHILECIEFIEQYIEGKNLDDFLDSVQLQDSVVRRVEIIGEAGKNISDDMKIKYRDIQWKKIAGIRDILIHEYFNVDLDLVWEIVNNDIPDLKEKILRIC